MPKVEKCVKCGLEVIQRARVADYSERGEQHLKVRVDADPAAIMFKQATRSEVRAYICGSCGFIELYAEKPEELYRASQAAMAKSSRLDIG
jgi:hypothetical protein